MPVTPDPTQAFRLEAGGPRCLLLHGFTGTPAELRYLGERLQARGFDVLAPCLPGHGRDFRTDCGADDWLAAARQALDSCAGGVRIAGLSMGALLGVLLAAERPDRVTALALLAPAVRLQRPSLAVARLVRRLPLLARLLPSIPKFGGSDVRDPGARAYVPAGARVPLHGLAELAALGERALAAAPRVRCPALVALGELDGTIDNAAARELAHRLGGPTELLALPESAHQVGIDRDRETLARAVGALFERTDLSHTADSATR
ncbi:MAG TPA: alpha/beta fold hydrolase [Myxococcales bacterium]|nr:alpha/beta fold hydrolase [Myxococcales bacterium]